MIAQGTNTTLPNQQWARLEGSFTFTGWNPPYENELFIVLKVFGAYSVNNLLIDNVSVREEGCEPVDVVEIVSNTAFGQNITSWAEAFDLNEQKIFRLTPSTGAFDITDIQLIGADLLRLQWQSLSGSHRYTVEETDGLPPIWLPRRRHKRVAGLYHRSRPADQRRQKTFPSKGPPIIAKTSCRFRLANG